VHRGQFEIISQKQNYFDLEWRHSKGGRAMSRRRRAKNRSKDAETHSVGRAMSRNQNRLVKKRPALGLSGRAAASDDMLS
jgi:hypothetical protein